MWSHLKRSLANLAKRNLAALPALVKTRLRRMQYRPALLEGFLARSKAGTSSLEEVFPQITVLGESGRQFTYYDLDVGYNILPGEVYLGKGRAFNTALYATVGMGAVKFAETDHFAINFGVGERVLITDWLAMHLDVRDHIFESDLFGENKNTHNIEATLGLTVFF